MPSLESHFSDIEEAFCSGSQAKRTASLIRVIDLFEQDARDDAEKARVFDDVMVHLINHVERRALVELSTRLAAIPQAPPETINQLARHDSAEVAGPILLEFDQLSDRDLIEIAETKSQAHLVSIAGRRTISEGVTEALVDHGNGDVANVLAGNDGARLSREGMAKLVFRAEGDERLTKTMSRRPDISPAMFRQLLLQATDTVRQKLLTACDGNADLIQQIMDALAAQAGSGNPDRRNYMQAQRVITALSQDTELMKSKVLEFAGTNRSAEVIAALSVLSGISIGEVDRLFNSANEIGLGVLCRSIGLSSETAYAVWMAACEGRPAGDTFDEFCRTYDGLSAASAQRILRFWQSRQRLAQHFDKQIA